jgi:hypothetical protein
MTMIFVVIRKGEWNIPGFHYTMDLNECAQGEIPKVFCAAGREKGWIGGWSVC